MFYVHPNLRAFFANLFSSQLAPSLNQHMESYFSPADRLYISLCKMSQSFCLPISPAWWGLLEWQHNSDASPVLFCLEAEGLLCPIIQSTNVDA